MRLLIAMLTLSLALPAAAQTARFAFDREAEGHVLVAPDTRYDAARGYGWEDAARFSVKLPEGNYRVTLVLGGKQASETTDSQVASGGAAAASSCRAHSWYRSRRLRKATSGPVSRRTAVTCRSRRGARG